MEDKLTDFKRVMIGQVLEPFLCCPRGSVWLHHIMTFLIESNKTECRKVHDFDPLVN
jgi:hypothetical protein